MNKNTKIPLAAIFLAAYLAILLMFFVFKDLTLNVFFLHYPISARWMLRIARINLAPYKTIAPHLRGHPRWVVAISDLLGNILPFMPLGFLSPALYRPISWKGVLGIAVAYSLCIEILQHVLRVDAFDVDDILLNTLGVMLGYMIFSLLANSDREAIDQHLRRWGTVRLRMTLWNVVVLAFILGVMGGVVRYTVQADLFATVDRTLAERAHADRSSVEHDPPVMLKARTAVRSRLLDPMVATTEGSSVGSKPGALPPLPPRIIPRDPASLPPGARLEEPWDRRSYVRSLDGRTVYSTVRDGRTPVRVLSMPIERRGEVDRVLQLVYPLDGVLREIDELTAILLTLAPFGLLAAGLGGAFLTDRALRPVREIAETTARLGANDLSNRLPVAGRDEFSELAISINAMLARLEEAFDRQRRFTADASHELRTPLSIVKANASRALERPWPADRYREMIVAIDGAADRQSRIVEELLFLARADAGGLARDVGPVCLIESLEEAAEAVKRPDRPNVRIEDIDPALMVSGSGSELYRLFANLLENAVRHTPPDGTVAVSATVDETAVTVTVRDTGEGIPPEHLPRLGERFYRVDAARTASAGGSGLGLAICRSIVDAHGGQMTIESEVGEGTSVRIRLPLRAPPSQPDRTRL